MDLLVAGIECTPAGVNPKSGQFEDLAAQLRSGRRPGPRPRPGTLPAKLAVPA